MIKVLHIVNRFNLGGHIYKSLYLAKFLPEDYQTLVVGGIHTEEEESAEFIFKKEGVDFILIPEMSRNISFKDDIKAFFKLLKVIREFKPDIVHTHASKAGLLGRLAAFLCRTPIIVHTFHGHVFHSYFSKWKTKVFISIEKVMSALSTAIIAVSEKQNKELSQEFKVAPARKTFTIPMGIKLDVFYNLNDEDRVQARKRFNIFEGDFVISITGRLVPIKNHKLFIDVIAKLKSKGFDNVKALVVGDGNLKNELIAQCQSLGLNTNADEKDYDVYFTSWIKDVEAVYAASDLVALTSHNEGTPVTIIEAQVCQKPIVTTDAGGTRDILVSSAYNKIAESNAEDFANAIIEIMQRYRNPDFIDTKAKEEIYRAFSYQAMVQNMDVFYKKLLND